MINLIMLYNCILNLRDCPVPILTPLDGDEFSNWQDTDAGKGRTRRQILGSDVRTRLEALNFLSNMTCVMREAGLVSALFDVRHEGG